MILKWVPQLLWTHGMSHMAGHLSTFHSLPSRQELQHTVQMLCRIVQVLQQKLMSQLDREARLGRTWSQLGLICLLLLRRVCTRLPAC